MHSIHESEIAAKSLPGRDHKMIVGPAAGMLPCKSMCGGVADFPPLSHAPAHAHAASEEIIYVLSGNGEIYLNGSPEPLSPGRFVSIPRGVEHSIRNTTSDGVLKLLYVFSPPVVQGSYG